MHTKIADAAFSAACVAHTSRLTTALLLGTTAVHSAEPFVWPPGASETQGSRQFIEHLRKELSRFNLRIGLGPSGFLLEDVRGIPLNVKFNSLKLAGGHLDAAALFSTGRVHLSTPGAFRLGFEFKLPGPGGVRAALTQATLEAISLHQSAGPGVETLVLLTDGGNDSQIVFVAREKVTYTDLLTWQVAMEWVAAFLHRALGEGSGASGGPPPAAGPSQVNVASASSGNEGDAPGPSSGPASAPASSHAAQAVEDEPPEAEAVDEEMATLLATLSCATDLQVRTTQLARSVFPARICPGWRGRHLRSRGCFSPSAVHLAYRPLSLRHRTPSTTTTSLTR